MKWPPIAWLVVFLVAPTAILASAAFSSEGLETLGQAATWALLGRSFGYAFLSTALCLLVSYPAALYIAGRGAKARAFLLFLVVLPFWTNLLVRTYALMFVFRRMEILNTREAVVIGLVQSFVPFMILPLVTSLEKIPPRLLEAARDLGASPWGAFWRVTVPLTAPGIAAGCMLVFIPVMGIFALPEFLGGAQVSLVGTQINLLFNQDSRSAAGSALTLVLMLFTAGLTALYARFKTSEGLA
ncbi:MAG TPA: ABC transporter permease [Planctomycetota bacterium]